LYIAPEIASVRQPLFGRVREQDLATSDVDRAERLLCTAAQDLARALDQRWPTWRSERVGLVVGTSSGAMSAIERAFSLRARGEPISREQARAANYFSPLSGLVTALGLDASRVAPVQVLAACASSTLAVGLGCRWLDADEYDWVIAGGYDALSALVASGFDALSALTRSRPRPFRKERDGMALGEGAALVALRLATPGDAALGRVLGFGASSDAVHVTAPDREGRGLVSAARAALADAELDASSVAWVSAHATATSYNDAAEARALGSLFGDHPLPVQPFKAVIGHTLGAAGALESLAVWDALAREILPAAAGDGELDANVDLPEHNRALRAEAVLKLSAAFGGCNGALVLGPARALPTGHKRTQKSVALAAFGERVTRAELELVKPLLRDSSSLLAERADSLSELVLAAVARLLSRLREPLPEATAVVVGSASATLELDERFDSRRRAGAAVEPRRFPPTSPNLCAGTCSIAFGFRGPSLSVGASLDPAWEALRVAHEWVAAGDAPAALVILAEDSGPVVSELFGLAGYPLPIRGARAALLAPSAGWPLSRALLAGRAGGGQGPLQGFFSADPGCWP
jgi:3-oxoacyl-[acyl-carrier-protein] synthase-1/3-oxoacyl-[acyl-carrier-protein] synthase II